MAQSLLAKLECELLARVPLGSREQEQRAIFRLLRDEAREMRRFRVVALG